MRGTIESVDSATATGTIRAKSGELYQFSLSNLVRRSMQPHVSARVVFRLKNGQVYKMAIGPSREQPSWTWGWHFWPLEWLLYLP